MAAPFTEYADALYAKNQKGSLTKAERDELKQLVPLLISTYKRRKQP